MPLEALVERLTFAAGEVSPKLRFRSDLARQQTAVWKCENMVVMPEGGLTRRPGTQFVMPLRSITESGTLVPFRFSTSDVLVLVINNGVIRFISNGGVVPSLAAPYEIGVPWAAADLKNLRYAQSGNVIFFSCDGYQPRVLTRNGSDTNWTLSLYQTTGGPTDVQNLTSAITIQASGVSGGVNLTGVGTNWDAGLINGVFRLDMANLNDVPIWVADDVAGVVLNQQRQFQGNVYQNFGVSGTPADAGPTPPTHINGQASYQIAAGGSVSWLFVNPGYGYVRITGVSSPTAATADVIQPAGADVNSWRLPSDVVSGGTYRWHPPAWSADAGWPNRVILFDDRLVWARTNQAWLTTNDNFYDFDQQATDASSIAIRLVADDGSLINVEWMMQNGLIVVGGHDGEYLVRGPSTYDPLTPSNIRAVPDKTKGSCPQIPARAEGGTLFLSRDRRRLHHIAFDPLTERTTIRELTIYARHALRGLGQRVVWQADPNGVSWVYCQDGSLVSVTFNLEQNLVGVARHPLQNGFVEDICAIQSADDTTTQICLIVRRVINGVTTRYVELLQPYFEMDVEIADASGAWYLDCALSYSGAPISYIGNLQHLIGEVVYAHADGCMQGPFTVLPNGSITLGVAASNIVVGKLIPWTVRTLPFAVGTPRGTSRGSRGQAHEVKLDVVNAAGGQIQVNPQSDEPSAPEALFDYGANAYGAPVPLFTGMLRKEAIPSEADNLVVVELTGLDTMPFTLTGISPAVQVEEQP
jgi:hypothetical protein